jgi:phosphonate transport system permease protein
MSEPFQPITHTKVADNPGEQEYSKPMRATRSPASTISVALFVLLLVILLKWSYAAIQFDFTSLHGGLKHAWKFVYGMFPHSSSDWSTDKDTLKSEWTPFLQTMQMDVVGTFVAIVLALPLSFFAARTTSLFRPLSVLIKTCLNVGRAIPVLVYALVIVAAIGLGAQAGTIAICFGTFMALTKLFAEALESISLGPVEAVKASGGNFIQIFVFGMLPQVFPNFLSAILYAFEWNIGASAILGIVGAGGIGFDMQNDINLFDERGTGVILALLIVAVNVVDYFSYRVRQIFA